MEHWSDTHIGFASECLIVETTQERIPLVPKMSPHDILWRFEVRQTAKIKYICLFIHEADLFSGLGKYEIV